MVTGLQSYNTSPASGFSVSFNEETSPYYTVWERQREGRFCSLILKFVATTVNRYLKKKERAPPFKVNSNCLGFKCPKIQRLKLEKSKKYSQQLKNNWMCFLLLNLLTACYSINSPSVLLQWFATGFGAQAQLALADIPSTSIRECHVWKYIAIIPAKKNT